jgi:hypothetical protein
MSSKKINTANCKMRNAVYGTIGTHPRYYELAFKVWKQDQKGKQCKKNDGQAENFNRMSHNCIR